MCFECDSHDIGRFSSTESFAERQSNLPSRISTHHLQRFLLPVLISISIPFPPIPPFLQPRHKANTSHILHLSQPPRIPQHQPSAGSHSLPHANIKCNGCSSQQSRLMRTSQTKKPQCNGCNSATALPARSWPSLGSEGSSLACTFASVQPGYPFSVGNQHLAATFSWK